MIPVSHQKKTKLATQDKSKRCSHSKCPNMSVITGTIEGRPRRLCQIHHDQYKRRNEFHDKAEFTKAGMIL